MKPTIILQLLVILLASCTAPPTQQKPPPDNISTHTINMVADLCHANDPAWQDRSTAEWLSKNVGGFEEHWQYTNTSWVYTVGPEEVGLSWTYTPPYKSGFHYPGFGSFLVLVFEADPVTVNATNADQFPRLKFTKLELTCP